MKRLLPYLRKNGIETRIIFFAANAKQLPAYRYFSEEGFKCKLIFWERFNEEKIIEILDDVKEFPPDIFIPNYFPVACYAAKWIKESGIPTVCILHNDDKYHIKLIDLFAAGDEKYKVSAMIGVSQLLTQLIKWQAAANAIVEYLPYGAPVPEQTAVLNTDDTLKLVYIGRMMENQKRISEVSKVFCRVAREIAGTECTLYGSGKDLPKVLEILKNEGNGLPVNYEGQLDTENVQQHLLQNHIFVLLSDYEGIPISLMEAMACGLVPVCLNIRSGMTELILQNETGFLVNDRNDDFVDTIKKIKSDYSLWQKISVAARKKITEEFSDEICNKRWLDFLIGLHSKKKVMQPLIIPTLTELRSLHYPSEFAGSSNPIPGAVFVPLYKLRSWAGRIRRNYLKTH